MTGNLPTTSVHKADATGYDAVKRALAMLPMCQRREDGSSEPWSSYPKLPDERLLLAMSRQFSPMQAPTPKQATDLVKLLTGAYPSGARPDAVVLTTHLAALFAEYPEHIVMQAIQEVPREHEFLSVKGVTETLKRIAADHAEMQRRAKLTLEEVRRRNSGQRALEDKRSEEEALKRRQFEALVSAVSAIQGDARTRLIARIREAGTSITDSMASMNTMLAAAARLAGITAENLTEQEQPK